MYTSSRSESHTSDSLCHFQLIIYQSVVVGTQDVKENPVMVYMKGVPQAPQCGFSAMVVRILESYGTIL